MITVQHIGFWSRTVKVFKKNGTTTRAKLSTMKINSTCSVYTCKSLMQVLSIVKAKCSLKHAMIHFVAIEQPLNAKHGKHSEKQKWKAYTYSTMCKLLLGYKCREKCSETGICLMLLVALIPIKRAHLGTYQYGINIEARFFNCWIRKSSYRHVLGHSAGCMSILIGVWIPLVHTQTKFHTKLTLSLESFQLSTHHLCILSSKQSITDGPPGIVDADLYSTFSCTSLHIISTSLQPHLPITTVFIGSWDSYGESRHHNNYM